MFTILEFYKNNLKIVLIHVLYRQNDSDLTDTTWDKRGAEGQFVVEAATKAKVVEHEICPIQE